MTLRDIEARKTRLRDYRKAALARLAPPKGLSKTKLQLEGSERWARESDELLAEHWPGEFQSA